MHANVKAKFVNMKIGQVKYSLLKRLYSYSYKYDGVAYHAW